MNLVLKKYSHLTIFYYLFIFILFIILINELIHGYQKESWQITEMLINYRGGFVRRGLLGEIFWQLNYNFNLSPYNTILFVCTISYLVFIILFVKIFKKKGYPIFILPFVFFLGGPIINDFIIRKDVIIILLFVLIIYFSNKRSKGYLFFVNLFLILALLIHEEIGFFCFPVLFLIFLNNNRSISKISSNTIKSGILSIVQLIPAIVTFGLVLYYNGSYIIAGKIWDSWKPVQFPIQDNNFSEIPAAIDGISWPLKRSLAHTVYTLKNFNDGIYAPIAWFFILILVYYLLTNINKLNSKIRNYKTTSEFNKINISNILILQIISFIPLFILGCDYGRWVFLWVTSSFTILALMPDQKITDFLPKYLTVVSSKLNDILNSILSTSKEFIYSIVLFIGVPACNWDIPTYLSSNSVFIIISYLSKLIQLPLLHLKEYLAK